jgi:hypothetical protein
LVVRCGLGGVVHGDWLSAESLMNYRLLDTLR